MMSGYLHTRRSYRVHPTSNQCAVGMGEYRYQVSYQADSGLISMNQVLVKAAVASH